MFTPEMPRERRSSAGAILVTGASSGIGRATAAELSRAGFDVFAGVRDTADAPRPLVPEGRVAPVELDVTDEGSVRTALATIGDSVRGRGLVGLVNNAGATLAAPLEYVSIDDVRRQFEVNVIGLLAVTQAALPLLRTGNGRIVMVGSLSGQLALPYYGPYAATKFALEALADTLRQELRPWGIAVSIVEPGAVATGIWGKALETAERSLDNESPHARARYGPGLVGVRRNAALLARSAARPEVVARAILRATTDRRPKARYRVAYSAPTRALRLLSVLPTGMRDLIVALSLPEHRA